MAPQSGPRPSCKSMTCFYSGRFLNHSGVPTCILPRFSARARHLCLSASIAFAGVGA
jgi:hypothetical protein